MDVRKVGVVHDKVLTKNKKKMVEAVKDALSEEYEVSLIPFDEDFMRNVKDVDFVFNLATSGGRDTRQVHVPAILDLMNIPYTGSSAFSHSLCLDKSITKMVISHYGVNTARFFVVREGEDIPETFSASFPLIVKPVREGSALGLTKDSVVYDRESLKRQVKKIHEEFNEPALVEEFIDGTEVTLGIIGNGKDTQVLPLLEIDFSVLPDEMEKFYSYRVKNELDRELKYYCPARLSKDVYKKVEEAGKLAFYALGLRDYARMDIRIKGDDYFILEVNSLPLLVPDYSDILKMAEKTGFSYNEFVLKILEVAKKRYM